MDAHEDIPESFSDASYDKILCHRATLFILSRANLVILADADKDKSPSALPNSLFFPINPAKTRYLGIKKTLHTS